MKRIVRSITVMVKLLPFLIALLRDRKRWILVGRPAKRSLEAHENRAKRLASTIAGLGPTFIKLAQLLSARADIFPEPYLSAVGTLQDQVPPVPTEKILEVIRSEQGKGVDELFDSFELEPEAAASLGQVHRAHVNGRDVVVKVLRPGVEETVALDLDTSFRLLFWLNILFPSHHVRALTNVVREFSHRVREEMDFRKEASNLHRFQAKFRDTPQVRAPEVLDEFTTRRVLVMEYCEGTKLDRLQEHFASGKLDFHDVMERLTGLYLRMMMVDGFLHADPHPGNILIQDDGTILLLDWGMTLDVPRWTREAIVNVALAVGQENLDGIINGMYQLGMISPEVSRGEVREAAIEIMRIMERAQTSSVDRIQEIVQEIFDTFYTWPLMLPQELVYFFRAGALLEGAAFRYDPNFDGLLFIRGVIRTHRQEMLKTTAREPAALARTLLEEAQSALRSMRELLTRAEREELRVRMHPRDVQGQERTLNLQARRLLLSIFATATAVISSVIFISLGNVWLLGAGILASLIMFILVLFLPTHLLENPLRHARGIRPGEW